METETAHNVTPCPRCHSTLVDVAKTKRLSDPMRLHRKYWCQECEISYRTVEIAKGRYSLLKRRVHQGIADRRIVESLN